MERFEANYIIANEEMQKIICLNNISSTINQLMTAMVIFVGVHLVFQEAYQPEF